MAGAHACAVDERRAWEGARIDLLGVISEPAKPRAQRIRIFELLTNDRDRASMAMAWLQR